MGRMLVSLLVLTSRGAAIQIWSSPGALPTSIPASCRVALSQNLTCSGGLITAQSLATGFLPDNATLAAYCQPGCLLSLQTFKMNVDNRCGNNTYQFSPNGSIQTGTSIADPLLWAYTTSCLQDQGIFCLPAIRNNSAKACSNCILSYGAAMLSNDYGRQKIQPGPYSSLLSSCGIPASSYSYNYTSTLPSTTISSPARPSCQGTPYTVQKGDTCQSVSIASSIPIDQLIATNGLDYNCTALNAGLSLCLIPGCALQTVQPNQTCADIVRGRAFTIVQLTSWNPTIHSNCDNLDSMVGRSICVSPPGTSSYQESSMNISTTTTTTITPMFSSGPFTTGSIVSSPPTTSTSWFYTQTNFTEAPAITVVYNATQASLINAITTLCPIQPSDIDNGWTVADLPDACQDLLEPFCNVDLNSPAPTSTRFPAVCSPAYWDSMSSASPSTATATPTPLEPGTISSCTEYYQVLDGDTCASISNHFKVELNQFYTWNPHVGSSCTGLWIGYYVCVMA